MGRKPTPKHSLDRIDNNSGYSPENCRWATSKEQNRNRRDNVMLTFNGQTKCVAEWAEQYGFPHYYISNKLAAKWPLERIFA
jgi:hypothetical protein